MKERLYNLRAPFAPSGPCASIRAYLLVGLSTVQYSFAFLCHQSVSHAATVVIIVQIHTFQDSYAPYESKY